MGSETGIVGYVAPVRVMTRGLVKARLVIGPLEPNDSRAPRRLTILAWPPAKIAWFLDEWLLCGFPCLVMALSPIRVGGSRAAPICRVLLSVLVALASATSTRSAAADAYGITHPRRHIDYVFELEPEAILVFGRPMDEALGLGVRGSIPVLFNGFVPSINNSVAVSFGIDKDPAFQGHAFNVPLALQWNFWLHRSASVFGEPGVLLHFDDRAHAYPQVWGGARLHFTDAVALTGRVSLPNTPAASLGVSFFF